MAKLVDFRPKWFGLPGANLSPEGKSIRIGFTFNCPCRVCLEHPGQNRLSVHIDPPIDPLNLLPSTTWRTPSPAWARTGDEFSNMTLAPSIDASKHGHWHGHVINGDLISA